MSNSLHCSVITPEQQVYEGDVESVVIPAHDGEIGILDKRAPLLCRLGAGEMRVRIGTTQQSWFINAGFAQVVENRVIVLTQQAIPREKLDRTQAAAALTAAQALKVTDDISARRKQQAETAARAQIRLAR